MEVPELVPTCVAESFGLSNSEIPDDNRLTDADVAKYIAPKKKCVIDPGNLPFKEDENYTGLDKKFPMYISKVLEFYEQGGRYKEFRNILKKQKRKEEKQKASPMPQKNVNISRGNFSVTFE